MPDIPIVVVAYNRPCAFSRLLSSLGRAYYPLPVKLIISIDGGENKEVVQLAKSFSWPYGKKEVLVSDQNMGLRKHVLQCGRLTEQYDGIVLLEDDLYVSSYFYQYVLSAYKVYHNENKVSGIALYSHQYNETACLPFKPFDDGFDVFFMQIPCSWGQFWSKQQWAFFESWYEKHKEIPLREDVDIPPDVRLWPDSSWKKYFMKYMIVNDLYFVYPRLSLSTNFADPGVHHRGSNIFQVPLSYARRSSIFPAFSDSLCVYDAYCEIASSTIKVLNTDFSTLDFSVDLYGMKNKREISGEYVLTTQSLHEAEAFFARRLKPQELNIFENIQGEDIKLGRARDLEDYGKFIPYRNNLNQDYQKTHGYFYSLTKEHYRSVEIPLGMAFDSMDKAESNKLYQKVLARLKSALAR